MTQPPPSDEPLSTLQTLEIHGLGFQGEGYHALPDHHFISIPHTLPGERVEARVGPFRRRRAWGALERVLEPSPQRVDPLCPHYTSCSGCSLRHISISDELLWKTQSIREILDRYGPPFETPPDLETICARTRTGHRVRGTFQIQRTNQHNALGLRSLALDRHIVDIRDCPAQHTRFLALMQAAGDILDQNPHLTETVTAISVDLGTPPHARLLWHTQTTPSNHDLALLTQPVLDVEPACILPCGTLSPSTASSAKPLALPHGTHAPVGSWYHPNPTTAALLMDWVDTHLPSAQTLLDVCCGLGTATLRTARRFERVIAIDTDRHAVNALVHAAHTRGWTHVEGRPGKAATILRKLLQRQTHATTALINPMRSPLGPKALHSLRPLGVQHIVYLGPSPVSATKDLKTLTLDGYTFQRGAVVNLHPGTSQTMFAFLLHRSPNDTHTPPVSSSTPNDKPTPTETHL